MIKYSVMYPYTEGSKFDHAYYRDTHMRLVNEHLQPHGLIKTTIDKGQAGGDPGSAPVYHCIGSLLFESEEACRAGFAAIGTVLRDDLPNFTDVTPVRQISEVVD